MKIARVDVGPTRNREVKRADVITSTGELYSTVNPRLMALCERLARDQRVVFIGPENVQQTKYGAVLLSVQIAGSPT